MNAIETTGAGDTFCGCSLGYLLEHNFENLTEENLREMLCFANAGAALVTLKKGAIRVMPDMKMIQQFIHNNQK